MVNCDLPVDVLNVIDKILQTGRTASVGTGEDNTRCSKGGEQRSFTFGSALNRKKTALNLPVSVAGPSFRI